MKSIQHSTNDSQFAVKIARLDLDCIKVKLMDRVEGMGWSRDEVDDVELKYKRFLYLNARYPDSSIVPTKQIDKFWHFHILDTEKYANDCTTIFGYFLHHFPYLGMRSSEDAKRLATLFANTQDLYLQEFGASLASSHGVEPDASCNSNCSNPSNCYSGSCDAGTCSAPGTIKRDCSRPTLTSSRHLSTIF